VSWIYLELVLVSLAAMLSPTTLTFSILALVLGDRPLRTGFFFYVGALTATLAIGVLAAFVLGDTAASRDPSTPKTWVAIVDVVAGTFLIVWILRVMRRPVDPQKVEGMVSRMSKVASSGAIAVVGAGAVLANPGGFIPLALKAISETDPSASQYIVEWLFFTLVSILPLATALLMLLVARDWAERVLGAARDWLVLHALQVAGVIVLLLAASLLRNGIAGLVG
jgi:Sap, sulfolipid-1-addressing protein